MLGSLVLWGVLASIGHARVIHPEPTLPQGWHRGSSFSNITFRISLKQPAVQELYRIAKKVSDPSDSIYGKHLTQKQLDAFLVPPTTAMNSVIQWAARGSCSSWSAREVVTVTCARDAAESLLETSCVEVQNAKTKQRAVRCSDFTLPDQVHEVTQAIYGLHGLPMPPRQNSQTQSFPSPPAAVTPAVITSTYKVGGVTPAGTEQNRQAVAEFQGQTMSSTDLDTFWKTYLPHEKPELGKVHKFVGDVGEGGSETEADLDIQYIMGVAPGVLTEFWYFSPSDFCGDLKKWTQMILADENPPLVHSVSYGWQGNMTTLTGCKMENVNDVDIDFAKIAARGISIVFASGDSGAGYTPPHPQCSPAPGSQVGEALIGSVAQTLSESNTEGCCYQASRLGGKGWTWEMEGVDTCGEQTVLEGVVLDGTAFHQSPGSPPVKTNTSGECCNVAQETKQEMWSFNKRTNECTVFVDLRGRHLDADVTSAIGSTPGKGTCTIFSNITGKTTNPRATSAEVGADSVKLYPSWPASSPWVTSVGGTRFVDQKVGQPEMATDQFGSGGGFSDMFSAFGDQKTHVDHYLKSASQLPPASSFPHGGRATPDVSALGEGFQVVIRGRASAVGGTSASAPTFAGLVSLLNEARLAKNMSAMGYLNPWLYQHADVFTDITLGDNLRGRGPMVEPYGFNCTEGWDPVTGLGTPRFDKMLHAAVSPSEVLLVV